MNKTKSEIPFFIALPLLITFLLLAVPGGPMMTIVIEVKTGSPALAFLGLIVWWSLIGLAMRDIIKHMKV